MGELLRYSVLWAVGSCHDTVDCRYNTVQYDKILHKWLQERRHNGGPNKDTQYFALTGEL